MKIFKLARRCLEKFTKHIAMIKKAQPNVVPVIALKAARHGVFWCLLKWLVTLASLKCIVGAVVRETNEPNCAHNIMHAKAHVLTVVGVIIL